MNVGGGGGGEENRCIYACSIAIGCALVILRQVLTDDFLGRSMNLGTGFESREIDILETSI